MKFDVPIIWGRPFSHATDSYFCLSKEIDFEKNMQWTYANVTSVTFPVPHSDAVPYPKCPGLTHNNKSADSS